MISPRPGPAENRKNDVACQAEPRMTRRINGFIAFRPSPRAAQGRRPVAQVGLGTWWVTYATSAGLTLKIHASRNASWSTSEASRRDWSRQSIRSSTARALVAHGARRKMTQGSGIAAPHPFDDLLIPAWISKHLYRLCTSLIQAWKSPGQLSASPRPISRNLVRRSMGPGLHWSERLECFF